MQKAVNTPGIRIVALAVAGAALVIIAGAGRADAALYQLSSGNSTVSLNPFADPSESLGGIYNWTVDGLSQARQQDFWIRINNGGSATEVSSIPASSSTNDPLLRDTTGNNGAANFASTTYSAPNYTVNTQYQLTGGAAGSNFSDLIEIILITNTGTSNLPVQAINYNDMNLGNDNDNDSTTITNGGLDILQTSANGWTATGTATPTPNEFTAGAFPTLLAGLTSGSAVPLGGNATTTGTDGYAVEYDQTLLPTRSLLFTVNETITGPVVPEPASASILAMGSLFLMRRRNARRQALL
jgi:hypothetical protein